MRGHVPAAEIGRAGDVSAVFLGRSKVKAAGTEAPVLSEVGGKTLPWFHMWGQESPDCFDNLAKLVWVD